MSQRVAGPVRTQRLVVRRPYLHARIRRVRLLRAVVQRRLALHRDQVHLVTPHGLRSNVPANVEPMVQRHRVAPAQIKARVVLQKILASPVVRLNLPFLN